MDFLLTIALIYFAYRGYQWYTALQNQVRGGDGLREVPEEDDMPLDDLTVTKRAEPLRDDDYIDYEEVD